MLISTCIGYLGSDAEAKSANGKEFITFRVAHSDRWTDDAGQTHENTYWVDCIMSGKPKVFAWLKKGQLVYVSGSMSLRVYSSAKDRCMKAGATINVRNIELLGGKGDDMPSVLFSAIDGVQVDVQKWYHAPSLVRGENMPDFLPLVSRSQQRYVVDRAGWIYPYVEQQQDGQQQQQQQPAQEQQDEQQQQQQ